MDKDGEAGAVAREWQGSTGAALAVLVFCAAIGGAHAADGTAEGTNPQLESRVLEVAQELRCLVCQNQTIADSNAPLAVDLRAQVREKLEQGLTREQIVEYMVQRYGEFVRYRPAMTAKTVLLWFGPVLALVVAVLLLLRRLRKRAAGTRAPLSAEERARAAAMLAGDDRLLR